MDKFSSFTSKHYPGFCIGLGIANLIFATIYGMANVVEARDAVEEKKRKLHTDELSPKETIKSVAPYFAPVVGMWAVGTGLILFGNQANLNRGTAAAVLAYNAIADHTRYVEKTREIVGEKKEQDIAEATARKKYYDDLNSGHVTVLTSGDGDFWIYDTLTNQKLKSTIAKFNEKINKINYDILHDTRVSVYEYCLIMGEDPIEFANEIGWTVDGTGIIELERPRATIMENGEPLIIMEHRVKPLNLY